MKKDKEEIYTVHDNDLEKFLKGINLYQEIKEGGVKCKFCKRAINLEDIHSFFRESGTVQVICDKPKCIKLLFKYLDKDK